MKRIRAGFNYLVKILSKPGFWFIFTILVVISIPYYGERLNHPAFLQSILSDLNLERHAFERILYLAPIILAGFLFGWKGAFATSLVALAIMLPRAISDSLFPRDALFESISIFVIGNVLAFSFRSFRAERENRLKLEAAQRWLQASEEKYRNLFENANDAIWMHDLEGNIINFNRAALKITGYTGEELGRKNIAHFLSEESLHLAGTVKEKMLKDEPVEQPYEQRLFRKDGTEAIVQLMTSLVFDKDEPVAFQHIARDISEQKTMQENLRYYINQVTEAQEEERKRISHELHDDTIQALVVLSRQLDALTSGYQGVPDEVLHRLEELWQQANNILVGVRRLSQDLRPAALDRLGLVPALEWLVGDVSRFSGIEVRINIAGTQRRLTEEAELILFRITQESLRNVWRHSGATRAEVAVEFGQGNVKIAIRDNGKGFDPPQKMGDMAKDGKLGLAGMQERAQLLGGKLMVKSEKNKGALITIELAV
jgi:PAS domain S-box-containing protein